MYLENCARNARWWPKFIGHFPFGLESGKMTSLSPMKQEVRAKLQTEASDLSEVGRNPYIGFSPRKLPRSCGPVVSFSTYAASAMQTCRAASQGVGVGEDRDRRPW